MIWMATAVVWSEKAFPARCSSLLTCKSHRYLGSSALSVQAEQRESDDPIENK
jgi:hypothetical protein